MTRKMSLVAVLVLTVPIAGRAQSGLAYDYTVTERSLNRNMESAGHAMVRGTNVRLDRVGPTSLSYVRALSFGDSISLISTGAGFAETQTILGHKSREYVQVVPWAEMARTRDEISSVPNIGMPVFTGKATLDSLGPSDTIAGFPTIHYRLTISVRVATRGPGGRTNTHEEVTDYYIAPDLREFSAGTVPWNGAHQGSLVFSANPAVPQSFLDELDAAASRLQNGLALREQMAGHDTFSGTLRLLMEVTNVRRADLPSDAFVVPPAYKKLELPRSRR